MSCTLVLHLSDIHAKEGEDLTSLGAAIARDCASSFEDLSRIVVCLSGDLSYGGSQKENEAVLDLCTALDQGLRERYRLTPSFVAVPGNHDCQLIPPDSNRDLLVESAQKLSTPLTNELGWACSAVQREFISLLDCLGAAKPAASPFVWVDQIAGALPLRFVCVNTAWMSMLHEPHGKARLPLALIEDAMASDEAELTLLVAHHPPAWLSVEDGRHLTELIASYADIALFGHEHISGAHAIGSIADDTISEFHFGSVLHNGESGYRSGFKTILISENGKDVKTQSFERLGEEYVCTNPGSDWRALESRSKPKSRLPQIEAEHERWLEDCGLNLTHPYRPGGPTLSDVFVWPQLRLVEDAAADHLEIASSQDLLTSLDSKLTIITGDELAGKTSLSKQLIRNLRPLKRFALYVDAKSITNFHDKYFSKFFKRATAAQYGENGAKLFIEQPVDRRVVVIDNFHRLNGNAAGWSSLRKFLESNFGSILVMANTDIESRAVDDPDLWGALLQGSKHYQLMPFGHQLRYGLIEKWYRLGREHSINEVELERLTVATKRQIDQFVDRRTVPALPAYVLIILQQMEAMSEAVTAVKDGSHGRLYEALITRDLDRRLTQLDLDGAFHYLKCLSLQISAQKEHELGLEDFKQFHDSHCLEYALAIDFEKLSNELIASRLLDKRYGRFRFRHPYIYYFFFGKYVAEELTEPAVESKISAIIESIYAEENYNILLFACFHDTEGKVLGKIEERAAKFYEGISEDSITDVSSLLADLQANEIEYVLADGKREEIRNALNTAQDHAYLQPGKVSVQMQMNEEQLKQVLEMNGAIKCLQLLGQILRNQAGTTRAGKKEKTLKVFRSLLGRITSVTGKSLRTSAPTMLSILAEAAKNQLKADEREAGDAAKKAFGGIVQRTCTSLLFRASTALASRHLRPVLDSHLRNDGSLDSKLTMMGALLESSEEFPKDEVSIAWDATKPHDVAARGVIRDLVVRRFLYHPDREEIKRSVCQQLSIQRRPLLYRLVSEHIERTSVL